MSASINPNAWNTTYHFAYGTSPTSMATNVPSSDATIGAQTTDQNVSQTITGLSPNTTYYVEVVATSAIGTATGIPEAFTTASVGGSAQSYSATSGSGAPVINGYDTYNLGITPISASPVVDVTLINMRQR